MNNDIGKIVETYRAYIQAFQSLNPKAILPFYHVPFMSISTGETRVMTSPAEIEDSFARNMALLREGKYARTEIIELYARQMSQGLALVSASLKRYSAAGEQLGGPGKTYTYTCTFRKTDDAWKIVSLMAHDAGAILKFN